MFCEAVTPEVSQKSPGRGLELKQVSSTPDPPVGRWCPRARGRTEPPRRGPVEVPAHHAEAAAGRSDRRPGLKRLSDLSNPAGSEQRRVSTRRSGTASGWNAPSTPTATATHKEDGAQRCDHTLTFQPSATLFAEAAPRHARAMTPLPESAGRLA